MRANAVTVARGYRRLIGNTLRHELNQTQQRTPAVITGFNEYHATTTRTYTQCKGSSMNDKTSQTQTLNTTNEKSNIRQEGKRHLSILERVFGFKASANELWSDILRYSNINSASKTKLNAWTPNHPYHKKQKVQKRADNESKGGVGTLHTGWLGNQEIRPGRIPRRQHEEQRLLRQDLRIVFPTVFVWAAIPIGGWLPVFFAVFFPRELLSRQFHTIYEIEHFACIEYRQRRDSFITLGDHFWNSIMVSPTTIELSILGHDAAGPILDLMPFYKVFSDQPLLPNNKNGILHQLPTKASLSNLDLYPREHAIALALVAGTHQSFRKELSHILTDLSPLWWLEISIRRIANEVYNDDKLLLEESYDAHKCQGLTDPETMDACLLRGLPVVGSYDEMRQCLTNHLSMLRKLKQQLGEAETMAQSLHHGHSEGEEGFKLFVLHLSALRWHLQEKRPIQKVS